MIPKKLHYCWYGNGPQSDLNKRCIESWQKVLSGYEIKEWNESNSPLDNEYCRACYEKGEWSRLSNHTRLHALYSEGGIYLDTDVEVLKDFAPLLDRKCFVGFQQQDEDTDWVNSAIMGSVPEHQFLKRCLNLTRELFSVTGMFYRSPTIITLALKGIGLEEYGFQQLKDVTIYPY